MLSSVPHGVLASMADELHDAKPRGDMPHVPWGLDAVDCGL